MHRLLRWQVYSRRQREIAFGLVAGVTAWQVNDAVKADSSTAKDELAWRQKPEVTHGISPTVSPGSRHKVQKAAIQDKYHEKYGEGPTATKSKAAEESSVESLENPPLEKSSAWQDANQWVSDVSDSLADFDFAKLGLKITDAVTPTWMRLVPGYVQKLKDELSGAPWSLGWEIWEDAHNPEYNPEILWDAQVRVSDSLCPKEQVFLAKRLQHTTKALAKYLDVPESEMHPEDVPIIAVCGSGGGLRALVAGASSFHSAQEAGLLDCVTYTAGVSGTCWLQALYYSSIGRQDYTRIIKHLKDRIGVHIAYPPAALSLLSQAPTNKFLLSGLVERLRGVPDAEFGIVDAYGLLLAARLLVPKGELGVSDLDLKVSNQCRYTDEGKHPLPIYTAVRHEIPAHLKAHLPPSQYAWHNTKQYDWFQWFEWTPYEFFCEELECGIPTWAVGRKWERGNALWRDNGLALPELRLPLMMGVWGSAFCATLSHYYKEIRPILTAGGLTQLDKLVSGKDVDLATMHPIDPAMIPNFVIGMRDRLPSNVPESIHEASHLQLMDAGMSNNLPIYPLLRRGRNVDIVVAFDASADVRTDNWIKVVDGYARQRGLLGWPMGAGWPPQSATEQDSVLQMEGALAATSDKPDRPLKETPHLRTNDEELGYCTVWVGTVEERQEFMDEPPPRRVLNTNDKSYLTDPNAGIAVVYFPFLPNDKVPGVDPAKAEFMSTWNFVYTPEQIDKVAALAHANFDEGKEQTRRTVRAVWERKRALRLEREKRIGNARWLRHLRQTGNAFG